MDATVAPTAERLIRASKLVSASAEDGAELVLLPELFNIGYGYTSENFQRAEPIDGQTGTWLKQTASKHNIHLAGTLLLAEKGEIFNSLLLFAPSGQMWRYDKTYPWGWERAYFRGRTNKVIANTALGDIGLLICWDAAHRKLWAQFAGEVDLMLISSCPPDTSNPTFTLDNGEQISFDDFAVFRKRIKGTGRKLFGDVVNQQTGWLGVPAVQTVGAGRLQTAVPRSFMTLFSYLAVAPSLLGKLSNARNMQLSCDFVQGCKVVDSDGRVLSELPQSAGESFTTGEVTVSTKKQAPKRLQPKVPIAWLTYFSSDVILPILMRPVYRRGIREK